MPKIPYSSVHKPYVRQSCIIGIEKSKNPGVKLSLYVFKANSILEMTGMCPVCKKTSFVRAFSTTVNDEPVFLFTHFFTKIGIVNMDAELVEECLKKRQYMHEFGCLISQKRLLEKMDNVKSRKIKVGND